MFSNHTPDEKNLTYCRGKSPQHSLASGTPPEFPLSRPDSIPLHFSVSRIFRKSLMSFVLYIAQTLSESVSMSEVITSFCQLQ